MRIVSPSATSKSLPVPTFTQSSTAELGLQSTLEDLSRCSFTIPDNSALPAVMERFIQFPDLPGAIIYGTAGTARSTEHCQRLLSRQQLLECLLHTDRVSPNESIRRLLHIASRRALALPVSTPIIKAAKQALKRSLEMQNAPILVQQPDGIYQLLDSRILNIAYWQIRGIETQFRYERLQMQLLQSEKMAALGRLVDGVAHEILDPVGFIWGNLSYIASYVQQQSSLLSAYESALPNPPAAIEQLAADIELDYLRSDLPAAIESAKGGAHRLKHLATSLQNFCHIDEIHPRPADINALIDSTLHLLKSRITTPIVIDCNYGKLPPIPCYAGQLSQVFMTLLTRAIDALLASSHRPSSTLSSCEQLDSSQATNQPKIEIVTRACSEEAQLPTTHSSNASSQTSKTRWVSIVIRDNGLAISPARQAQILDSFSTKSRSRKESGIALSYQIVTAKHGGRFRLRSLQNLSSNQHSSLQSNSQNIERLDTGPLSTKSSDTDLLNATNLGTEFEILLPLDATQTSLDDN